MKKIIYSFILVLIYSFTACNYLDIVPDERPTEEDAFKDKKAAERYLYSCYAFMPLERQGVYLYQHGESVTDFEKKLLQSNYSAADIGEVHFWSRLYGGIKRCYQLIRNIDAVPRLEEENKIIYKAEAKYLIAYYHFCLMRAYGPVIIADQEFDVNMNIGDMPKRAKFDDCLNFVSALLDEASNDLVLKHTDAYYGRITKVGAKALKSRLWLYAASPLFNGNSQFYSKTLLDPETSEPLMNLTYDPGKWESALRFAEEAIEIAESTGHILYRGQPTERILYPEDPNEFSLRMTYIDRDNREVIIADPRRESKYELQNQCTPRDPNNDGASWNGVAPSLECVMGFYTSNGLPIKEDPNYYNENEYFEIASFEGEKTCKMHIGREPRFYAWIGFHNGWYEIQRDGKSRFRSMFRNKDIHGKGTMTRNFSLTGYLFKKGVGPTYDTQNGYPNYSWPLLRLAEIYLNAAEAAVETGNLELAKNYLNKVRERAGIPDVDTSWKGIAILDQRKLREIVQQERMIEFTFEGHLLWDLKRWLRAEEKLNSNPWGLNVNGVTDEEFFRPTEVELLRKFNSPTNYLLPIDNKEININRKIVQNPGY